MALTLLPLPELTIDGLDPNTKEQWSIDQLQSVLRQAQCSNIFLIGDLEYWKTTTDKDDSRLAPEMIADAEQRIAKRQETIKEIALIFYRRSFFSY